MLEYRINDFITLKMEYKETEIYMNDKKFSQCKGLLLNIPTNELKIQNEVRSIDDLEREFSDSFEMDPDEEFWAHCSNLQAWYENDYDTRLIHRTLAFPLLKKLTEAGDTKASHMFKEEIINRFSEGNSMVNFYLINEEYLEFFSESDLELIALDHELNFIKNQIMVLEPLFRENDYLADESVAILERLAQNNEVKTQLKKTIIELLDFESDKTMIEIISYELYKYLDSRDLRKLFKLSPNKRFYDNLKSILFETGRKYNFYNKNPSYIFSMFVLFFACVYIRIGKKSILKLFNSFEEAEKISFKLRLNNFLEFATPDDLRENPIGIEGFVNTILSLNQESQDNF